MFPVLSPAGNNEPCCGAPAGPPSSPYERPGYTLCPFVKGFVQTPVGAVPRVGTTLHRRDRLGAARVRLGIGRNDYKVAPGIYAAGIPDRDAPVLVTANYKLTFDAVRRCLGETAAWLLVLDTCGINVWCAAGKGAFSTQELVRRVRSTRLAELVHHRRLILPQLGATGVAARMVKKACGFEVVWGPVRAADIPVFLSAPPESDTAMRRVTFTLPERLVLVPFELMMLRKYILPVLAGLFVLSGIGPPIFSIAAAWERGFAAAAAAAAGIFAGSIMVPALLPWIPGRAFAVKGIVAGLFLGLLLGGLLWDTPRISTLSGSGLVLLTTVLSSFLAMNFTGCTPFTSPSGVEKEMRHAIPLQAAAVLLAAGLWIGGAFA
ncbi:MAG: hypothetical protein C4519_24190 [Desulfobacteraceae bacterium]|nr:MAG: hypothetical protein C4519_24190 [Desulfobacteraceae bacterium]